MPVRRTKQAQPSFDPYRYWDERTAAAFLCVSVEFLQQDRSKHRRIPFVKLGRAVRYHPDDVKAYAERCKVPASPPA